MKNGYIFKKNLLRFFFLTLASCFIVACNDDDDATNSLDNRTSLVLTPSDYEIELKEDTPDEVALTLNWTEADPIALTIIFPIFIKWIWKITVLEQTQ